MSRPSLNDLSAFAAVAQQRSFRKAADTLGVSRSALSHAVIALERDLGVRLLHRTTRSVSATPAGQTLLDQLAPVLRDLDAALDGLADARGTPSGPLRINANKPAAAMLLEHVVPTFLQSHPGVELDLVTEGRLVDIVEQGFDAGVRLMEAVPQDMVAVRFGGEVRFLAVAAPSYLAQTNPPATPQDLLRHRCIRQRLPGGKRYRWEFVRHGVDLALDVPGPLTLDEPDLIVDAAVRGLGIAYAAEPIARPHLVSGRLIALLEEWCPPFPGLALYYPGNRHVPAALRAFIDALKAADAAGVWGLRPGRGRELKPARG